MVFLSDMFERHLLEQMLEQRYVKVNVHPQLPLRIYNYTSRAQFDRVWNDVTRACRGLIVDEHDTVVARPFAKFFNLEQHEHRHLPAGPVHVTEKLDGSLGILYPTGSGHAVATRGSFVSDQAAHATGVWQTRYANDAALRPEWTYLCEIIYPQNRIVVDYNGLDDLVLLGAVDTHTGASIPLAQARVGWPGLVVDEHPYTSAAEALAAPERGNAEGFVIHFVDVDVRVKVKHDEYVRLHRLFTDVSERRVWEALAAGASLDEWLDGVPDEFYAFVHATRDDLLGRFMQAELELRRHLDGIVAELPQGHSRREFADAVTRLADTYPLAPALFALADGKDHTRPIWASLRPAEHRPLFAQQLDSE